MTLFMKKQKVFRHSLEYFYDLIFKDSMEQLDVLPCFLIYREFCYSRSSRMMSL
jgi:hypothetical protein